VARAPGKADTPDVGADLTVAEDAAVVELPPEVVAQTLGDYARATVLRLRSGESGVLPVIVGLLAISIVFQSIGPNGLYLSPGNLVNLFQQSAVFMVLAMAEGFALILGEIDLSIGYVGACGAAITVQLVQPVTTNWPWWAAVLAGLAFCFAFGFIQGALITRLRLPSFIVTLAGFLIGNGLMLIILLLGPFSGFPSLAAPDGDVQVVYNLMWAAIDPTVSWIAAAALVAAVGALIWFGDSRRRRSGLVAPPASLSAIKIGLIAATAIVVVAICSVNRANFGFFAGVPWVIPIVLGVFGVWTVLLTRTRYGRYVYAIGGNPEAARRAGVNLAMVRTIAFALCALTAGIGMLLFASYLGGMSNNVNGGSQVLYAVAAAVIGGTSLFGGRGKPLHGLLGGLVIGAIYNGTYLIGLAVQYQFIVTGLVLVAAVTVDSVSRRGATSGSVSRV